MTDIVKLDLNGAGIAYMNSRLKVGGQLARAVLQRTGGVDNAYSELPAETGSHRALQFDRGGITTQISTMKWLASDIESNFEPRSKFCLVIEDTWAKWTDSAAYMNPYAIFISDLSVSYGLLCENINDLSLNGLMKSVTSYDYTAFIAECPLEGCLYTPDSGEIEASVGFSKQVRRVMVSTYDREGLVVSEVGKRELR